VIPSYRARY